MTDQELQQLNQEELINLRHQILQEVNRRESLTNIPQDVIRAAEHYRSLGGSTLELITAINSLPEEEIEE